MTIVGEHSYQFEQVIGSVCCKHGLEHGNGSLPSGSIVVMTKATNTKPTNKQHCGDCLCDFESATLLSRAPVRRGCGRPFSQRSAIYFTNPHLARKVKITG